jgi:hypothetical protein
MTQWAPVWRVIIDGTEYTDVILANLSITSGRTNIYTQAQAGYCSVNLINLNIEPILFDINDSLTIEVKDSAGVFIPIFGGNVVDIGVTVSQVGSVAYTQEITLTALGKLSRLQKTLTDGVLTQDFDGNQIYTILSDLLLNTWSEVPPALTWATYTPASDTWATAQNLGLGEIDTPGEYELAARSSDRTVVWDLVAALATSGLGYIYENGSGQISYASALHRSIYLAAHGYTNVSANNALGQGITIKTSAGDVRNDITLKYGASSASEVSDSDPDSILVYSDLSQIISTTLKHAADATSQAAFYLTLRAYPQALFDNITFPLTNPEIDDADRDALIGVFMGQPISLADLPPNMVGGNFLGFVEGFKFQASYNQLAVTLIMSPLAYSIQAMKWQDVSVAESWATIVGTLDWEHALVVA